MLRPFIILFAILCLSCGGRSYEEGVRSRVKWVLGTERLPESLVVGGSTIDGMDEWPTYQVEMAMSAKDFESLLSLHEYEHLEFPEQRTPYEQAIELATPFEARGVYRRRLKGKGMYSLFHEAEPGRYFLLYMDRANTGGYP